MLSYCVRERKMTNCKPGSEQIVKTKNNRYGIKYICDSCGSKKFRFISKAEIQGSGLMSLLLKDWHLVLRDYLT